MRQEQLSRNTQHWQKGNKESVRYVIENDFHILSYLLTYQFFSLASPSLLACHGITGGARTKAMQASSVHSHNSSRCWAHWCCPLSALQVSRAERGQRARPSSTAHGTFPVLPLQASPRSSQAPGEPHPSLNTTTWNHNAERVKSDFSLAWKHSAT